MISKYNLYFTKKFSKYRTVSVGIYRTGSQTGTDILVFRTSLNTYCMPVIPANIGVFRPKKENRPVREKKTLKTKIAAEVDTR